MNKDRKGSGYTPPGSPAGSGLHGYRIRVFALSAFPAALGKKEDPAVGLEDFMAVIAPLVLAAGELAFTDSN